MATPRASSYNADAFDVFSGLDPARKRPALHTAIAGGHRRRLQGSAGLVALLGVAGLALGWWLGRRR